MRPFIAGCAGLLGVVTPLVATEPQMARIVKAEVEVRGGPSEKYPITARLQINEPVYVIGPAANPGWLEIVPPAGSFCWVPDRVVQQVPNSSSALFVLGDEVPLRMGGTGFTLPLDVECKVKVKRGAQLTIRGEKVIHEQNRFWWPVAPPTGDVRYMLADSIAAVPGDNRSASAKTSASPNLGGTAPGTGEPREWSAAIRAEKDGRYEDAYRIYATLAQQHSGPGGDFTMVGRCSTRMRELVEGGYVKSAQVGAPKVNIPGAGSPAVRSGSSPVGSLTSSTPAPPLPVFGTSQMPPAGPPIQPLRPATQGTRGYLRRAGFMIDNQTTYALEDSRRNLLLYATAGAGVDLESLVGQPVELLGPAVQRGDVRGGVHMTVNRVYLLR